MPTVTKASKPPVQRRPVLYMKDAVQAGGGGGGEGEYAARPASRSHVMIGIEGRPSARNVIVPGGKLGSLRRRSKVGGMPRRKATTRDPVSIESVAPTDTEVGRTLIAFVPKSRTTVLPGCQRATCSVASKLEPPSLDTINEACEPQGARADAVVIKRTRHATCIGFKMFGAYTRFAAYKMHATRPAVIEFFCLDGC